MGTTIERKRRERWGERGERERERERMIGAKKERKKEIREKAFLMTSSNGPIWLLPLSKWEFLLTMP
jgi:hypothetical protein